MARKCIDVWPHQPHSVFDIGFEPLIPVGSERTLYSTHEIMLRQLFNDALEGDAKALRQMIKVMRLYERERMKLFPREPVWLPARDSGDLSADKALQLLGMAKLSVELPRYKGGESVWTMQLAHWVVKLAVERQPHLSPGRAAKFLADSCEDSVAASNGFRLTHTIKEPDEKKPAGSTRFKPGQSGNPNGRPRKEAKPTLPYGAFLEEIIPLPINGELRKVTRLEALYHQCNCRAIKGDDRIYGLLFNTAFNEYAARWKRQEHIVQRMEFQDQLYMEEDPFAFRLRKLKLIPAGKRHRALLMPWIVQEALSRLGRQLNPTEQETVVRSTSTPKKVQWPQWWEICA